MHQLITEYAVGADISFRLGTEGPTLRFRTSVERIDAMATISSDTMTELVFQLDDQKLQAEVGEIADGDYFQNLQAQAKKLRRKRNAD